MKKKIVYFLLLSILAIILLISSKGNHDITEKDEQLTIGLSFDSLVIERWKRDLDTFLSYASEKNVEVLVEIANDDLQKQKEQINSLIDRRVEILVILPIEDDALTNEIERAKKRGIKVIAYDRLITGTDIDYYVSFDNEGIGKSMAEKLVKVLQDNSKPSSIIIINGDPKDNNSLLLREGYADVIDELIENNEISIVKEVWAEGWREDYAAKAIEDAIKEGNEIDGVIASNDALAGMAIKALTEYKLHEDVPVVSQDAELSACQRIVEGTQLATVFKPVNKLSEKTIDLAIELFYGISPSYNAIISNGKKDIKYIKLDYTLVDKENIEESIIKSGFHLREDVYINIDGESNNE